MPEPTDTTNTTTTTTTAGNIVPTAPVVRTFSQAEVEAMMAKEKDRAQRSGRDAFIQSLGVANAAEAEALLKEAQAKKLAEMSEAEKARALAEAERTAATAERTTAAQELLATRTERALIRAGIPLEVDSADGKSKVENPQLQYAARLVDVKPGDDAETIAAAVAKIKADLPMLFGGGAAPAATAPAVPAQRPPRNANNAAMDPKEMAAKAREQFGFRSASA